MWCKCSLWICTLFFVCEEVKTLTFVRKDHEVRKTGIRKSFWWFMEFVLQNRKLQLEITNGFIQGKKQVTEKKHLTYYSFQGIPYAQPPVQNLRFRVKIKHYLFYIKKVIWSNAELIFPLLVEKKNNPYFVYAYSSWPCTLHHNPLSPL